VQATKVQISSPIFPASPLNTYFCNDPTVPAHKKVLSFTSSKILKKSGDDVGKLEGLAWTISCQDL